RAEGVVQLVLLGDELRALEAPREVPVELVGLPVLGDLVAVDPNLEDGRAVARAHLKLAGVPRTPDVHEVRRPAGRRDVEGEVLVGIPRVERGPVAELVAEVHPLAEDLLGLREREAHLVGPSEVEEPGLARLDGRLDHLGLNRRLLGGRAHRRAAGAGRDRGPGTAGAAGSTEVAGATCAPGGRDDRAATGADGDRLGGAGS